MSGGSTANCTSQTASSVVLTVQSGTVAASTAATVTLTGFTMGVISAAIPNSFSVMTSNDANAAGLSTLSSGHIGNRAIVNSFVIANDDRIEFKSGVAATLTFTPSAGGEIAAGGSLTLFYPPSFFSLKIIVEMLFRPYICKYKLSFILFVINNLLNKLWNSWGLWNANIWFYHHILNHHSFTGEENKDPDLYHLNPFLNKLITLKKSLLHNKSYLYVFLLLFAVGLALGITGLIMGTKGLKNHRENSGSTIDLVFSIVGTALGGIAVIASIYYAVWSALWIAIGA
jgi:hypothetical protein